MAMLGQSSFRRILLSRILVLSIPILLLGVGVTFRKARTSLLYTARQNLAESAIRKAEDVQSLIKALQTNLATASRTSILQAGQPETIQTYLNQLATDLPTEIHCLQLIDWQTGNLTATTCGNQPILSEVEMPWATQQSEISADSFYLNTLSSKQAIPDGQSEPGSESTQVDPAEFATELNLIISTPVYDQNGQLRYTLAAQSVIQQRESGEPGSLLGYTTIIDEDGVFLAHPLVSQVGQNIKDEPDADRFENIVNNVLRGDDPNVRHIFNFVGDQEEWLAGYSPIHINISPTEDRTWTVLAVTRLDSALHGLEDIKRILVILTTGLLAAHLLAMLYMARDLALPIEQLGKYARHIHKRDPLQRAPKNFRIRELNHLAEVLDNMVRRLEERAKELEAAWQEAEAANQLKSEFLANTSHELRTPLNAIIGCIRLVRDDCCDTPEEEVEFLDRADEAAIHLLKIINDLLDIAKIEAGTLSLSIELIDLRRILQEVIDLQSMQIHEKGLRLGVPEMPEPVMVRSDPAKLKQVLLNVIYNAIKFTDHGSITIDTRIETAVDSVQTAHSNGHRTDETPTNPEAWVIISVQDTGIGIDPTQQHKLFRPFVMVDGTTTRKFEGTGLGLAISRNLIELMGGSITLHSAGVGQGTTVEIALPIAPVSQLPAASSMEPESSQKPIAEAVAEHPAVR
ncbi:MAG: two-component sensor histidine kinase [Leptolyngbyaceae cyanobacterium RM1_406_9]|nr:two-component sensor histidine kinase [Leptolyngbyaceae cyanobacterium RM1_406_9]